MTPSSSLRSGSSCRWRCSGGRTRGGSQHGDLKPEAAGASDFCQMQVTDQWEFREINCHD